MTNHQYGPKGHIVDAFLEHLKQMTEADWRAVNDARDAEMREVRVAAFYDAQSFARRAAKDAVGLAKTNIAGHMAELVSRAAVMDEEKDAAGYAAGSAVRELLGADLLRERGQPFFFLPMFGFADEQAITKREAPTTMIFGVEVKGDHTFDRDSVERYIEQAHKYGQEDERAKIVAWLEERSERLWGQGDTKQAHECLSVLARLIEGEHLK